MNIKISKATLAAILVVILAVAAYWHWSPYLTIHRMQAAAKAQDPDTFNDYVDYPKLRESFKGQLTALMVDTFAETKGSENAFVALGAMMAMGMVGNLVDAMVRPEAVMHAMQDGKLSEPGKRSSETPPLPRGNASQPGNASDGGAPVEWAYERKGANKVIAYAIDPKKPDAAPSDSFGVVFQRSGFADWKLTEVRMPNLHK
jgi:hypothetical protein